MGGTKIEAAALAADGGIAIRRREATPTGDYDATLELMTRLVHELEHELGQRCSVGVAIPGTISAATGRVKNANSTWLIDKPLDRDLEHCLERQVRIANDADWLCPIGSSRRCGSRRGNCIRRHSRHRRWRRLRDTRRTAPGMQRNCRRVGPQPPCPGHAMTSGPEIAAIAAKMDVSKHFCLAPDSPTIISRGLARRSMPPRLSRALRPEITRPKQASDSTRIGSHVRWHHSSTSLIPIRSCWVVACPMSNDFTTMSPAFGTSGYFRIALTPSSCRQLTVTQAVSGEQLGCGRYEG